MDPAVRQQHRAGTTHAASNATRGRRDLPALRNTGSFVVVPVSVLKWQRPAAVLHAARPDRDRIGIGARGRPQRHHQIRVHDPGA